MIRVTITLIPKGDEDATSNHKTLGTLDIWNDGTGTQAIGNYQGTLYAEYAKRHGAISNFHRQTQSVWSLVGAFLKLFGHTRHAFKEMHQGSPPDKSMQGPPKDASHNKSLF